MSIGNVEKVISRLLCEEELRIRFVVDPFDALADLQERGTPLTSEEIDVFMQSDSLIWFMEYRHLLAHVH
jgi:hypothetical protein